MFDSESATKRFLPSETIPEGCAKADSSILPTSQASARVPAYGSIVFFSKTNRQI
jgi:hypothetical protein